MAIEQKSDMVIAELRLAIRDSWPGSGPGLSSLRAADGFAIAPDTAIRGWIRVQRGGLVRSYPPTSVTFAVWAPLS